MALECFIGTLIPARMHLTVGVRYKQPALMTILMRVNVLLHVPRLNLHASDHFVTSRRPTTSQSLSVFLQSRPVRTATWARLSVTSSLCRQANSQEVKVSWCQKATQPTEPTLKKPVSKWSAAFFLIRRCATCCLVLAKDHLMEQTHAGPARLSLTSIKPNKSWAQAVRLWNIHWLDTQTSIRDASPLHCAI